MRRLVLASASPARRYLLESAGLHPEVVASEVPEDGVEDRPPLEAVAELARRKAEAVAARFTTGPQAPLVIACDSMLELDGEMWGKADTEAEVAARWKRMRGGTGLLHTGHFLIDTSGGRRAGQTDTAVVRFGRPTDREVAAYAATSESRQVAGPFTLEGRSAPWIESIDGNYGTITGLSLAVLRRLLLEVGVEVIDLWR